MKKKIMLLICVILLFSLYACGSGGGSPSATEENLSMYDMAMPEVAPMPTDAVEWEQGYGETYTNTQATGNTASGAATGAQTQRKLIRSGSLEIETLEFERSISVLEGMVSDFGGYIESSNVDGSQLGRTGYEWMRSAYFSVRIPAENFDAFLDSAGDAGSVLRRNTGSEDVTDSYFDIEAHLETLYVKEERLLDILSRATKLSDIIELEDSLSQTRYEIESLTGKLRKYDGLIQYSTISVSLYERQILTDTGEEAATFGERIAESFTDSLISIRSGFKEFTIWFAGALPYLVILSALGGCVFAVIRVRMKKRRIKAAALSETPIDDNTENTQ